MNPSNPINILTIDLEDYFMVSAFESVVKRENWDKYESRIERNTHRLLDILASCSVLTPYALHLTRGIKATFFCLGWVAERYPKLIKEVHWQGHEIACHGYDHRLLYDMTPDGFREDIRKAKKILEDIIGDRVIGYRAPSYSITKKSLWALQILFEEGYRYDSSIFPIHHDVYGFPNAPRFPFIISLNGQNNFEFRTLNFGFDTAAPQHGSIEAPLTITTTTPHQVFSPNASRLAPNGTFIEIPLSTIRFGNINFPISGGGYFRLFPYSLIRKGFIRINEEEKKPFVFYFHPWELDFEQPRINGAGWKSKFRHYINLDKAEGKFKKLLEDFQFSTIKDVLKQNLNPAVRYIS